MPAKFPMFEIDSFHSRRFGGQGKSPYGPFDLLGRTGKLVHSGRSARNRQSLQGCLRLPNISRWADYRSRRYIRIYTSLGGVGRINQSGRGQECRTPQSTALQNPGLDWSLPAHYKRRQHLWRSPRLFSGPQLERRHGLGKSRWRKTHRSYQNTARAWLTISKAPRGNLINRPRSAARCWLIHLVPAPASFDISSCAPGSGSTGVSFFAENRSTR
jgi:hypothetical protein